MKEELLGMVIGKMTVLLSVMTSSGLPDTNEISHNSFFDRLVEYVGNTYLFQRYVSSWAPPFDNASFDTVLLLVLLGVLIWTAFGIIMNIIYHYRARKKQAQIRSDREQYMQFLKNHGSDYSVPVDFDEWREMKKSGGHEPLEENEDVPDDTDSAEDEIASQPIIMSDDHTDAEIIKKKYDKKHEATELLEKADDDKVVSIAESSIARELEPEPAKSETEEREPVDVGKLLEEKTTEMCEDSMDDNPAFSSLIGNLRVKQRQEARAKEIENAARQATEYNLEMLKSDMESAISENRSCSKKTDKTKQDTSALSAAQKKAIQAREKERQKMKRRGKNVNDKIYKGIG